MWVNPELGVSVGVSVGVCVVFVVGTVGATAFG